MQALYAQLLVGLINGSFYALLSLGLAVIFGMLNIINFAHGALYMMGAFVAYFLLNLLNVGYWPALIIAPIVVGIFGMLLERTMLQWLAGVDHLFRLLVALWLGPLLPGGARPSLRLAVDLWSRADHPGRVPEFLRLFRPAIFDPRCAEGRHQSRL